MWRRTWTFYTLCIRYIRAAIGNGEHQQKPLSSTAPEEWSWSRQRQCRSCKANILSSVVWQKANADENKFDIDFSPPQPPHSLDPRLISLAGRRLSRCWAARVAANEMLFAAAVPLTERTSSYWMQSKEFSIFSFLLLRSLSSHNFEIFLFLHWKFFLSSCRSFIAADGGGPSLLPDCCFLPDAAMLLKPPRIFEESYTITKKIHFPYTIWVCSLFLFKQSDFLRYFLCFSLFRLYSTLCQEDDWWIATDDSLSIERERELACWTDIFWVSTFSSLIRWSLNMKSAAVAYWNLPVQKIFIKRLRELQNNSKICFY